MPEAVCGFSSTKGIVDENDAYPSGFGLLWGTSESIGVYGTNLTNSEFVSTNKYQEVGKPAFRGSKLFSRPEYAYYPYNEGNASNPATAVKGNVPQTQYYSTVLKKMTTDYKIGKYDSWSMSGYRFTFSHILTFLRYEVNADGTALEGDALKYIELEAVSADGEPRQLWGDFTMDITKSNDEAITGWDVPESGKNKLTLLWVDEPVLKTGSIVKGYLSGSTHLRTGDIISFKIVTDKHIARLTRTSKMNFGTDVLVYYPLTLSNFADMEVEEIPPYEPVVPDDTHPVLNSFKFTVADNPGKILNRRLIYTSGNTTYENVSEELCEVDTVNNKISLYLPYLNNRNLIPTFEIPDGTRLISESGEIVSGETSVDFTQCKQVAVVNEAGDAAVYDIEFKNTGLPVVVVNQVTGTVSTESNSDYTKGSTAWYNATGAKWLPKDADWQMTDGADNFMIYNADGTPALTDKNGATVSKPVLGCTRLRGNVTQQMPKKAFAVKLDKKHGMLDMPAHKRWVLLANWKDRTLLRNAVAFGIADVFKEKFPNDGIAWNPSGKFVELVYNGVYVGNYYLCEQIKIDANRLDINDPYSEGDAFTSAADYGYLMECDDGFDEKWQFVTKHYVPFLFKDDGNDEMLQYAKDIVFGVEENLYKGYQGTSSAFEEAFKTLDISSVVDFLLIQEVMMNSELQHPKSCYMYINNGKLYAGPVWDFDWNTLPTDDNFECNYSYTASLLEDATKTYRKYSGYPSKPLESDKSYMWYPMLLKSDTFKSVAKERWDAVKGALNAYASQIPSMASAIAASEAENYNMWRPETSTSTLKSKWDIGGHGICGDEGKTYNEAVQMLQDNLERRISGMDYVSTKTWPSVSISKKYIDY